MSDEFPFSKETLISLAEKGIASIKSKNIKKPAHVNGLKSTHAGWFILLDMTSGHYLLLKCSPWIHHKIGQAESIARPEFWNDNLFHIHCRFAG